MTRTGWWIAVGFAVAFALVAVLRLAEPEELAAVDNAVQERREQVAGFWALFHQATGARAAGDFAAAAGLYRQALEVRRDHEESWFYLGSSRLELGDEAGAEQAFLSLVELNPRSLRGHSQLGLVRSSWIPGREADLAGAKEAFARSLELDPEDSGVYLRLGIMELRSGATAEALTHFLKAAGSASPEGMFRAGYVNWLQGQEVEARRMFERVLETARLEQELANRGARVEGDQPEQALAAPPAQLPSGDQGSRGAVPVWAPLREAATLARYFLDLLDAGVGSPLSPGGLQLNPSWIVEAAQGCPPGSQSTCSVSVAGPFESAAAPPPHSAELPTEEMVRLEVGRQAHRVETLAVDLDGDGVLDHLEAGRTREGTEPVRIRLSLWEAAVDPVSGRFPDLFPKTVVRLVAGDLDGDARPDVLALVWKQTPLVYWNEGEGRFSVEALNGAPSGLREARAAALLDIDGDGRLDVVLGRRAGYAQAVASLQGGEPAPPEQRLVGLSNLGNRRFRQVEVSTFGFGVLDLAVADVDRDGRPDLLVLSGDDAPGPGRLEPGAVLLNKGDGSFVRDALLPPAIGEQAPARFQGIASDHRGTWLRIPGAGLFMLAPRTREVP